MSEQINITNNASASTTITIQKQLLHRLLLVMLLLIFMSHFQLHQLHQDQ